MASKSLSDALVQRRRRRVLKRNTVERNLIIVMAVIRWAWSLASKGADTQLDGWPRGSLLAEWMCYMIWVRATQVPCPSLSIKFTAKNTLQCCHIWDSQRKELLFFISIILLYIHGDFACSRVLNFIVIGVVIISFKYDLRKNDINFVRI